MPGSRWTTEEDAILKRHYIHGGAARVVEILQRYGFQRKRESVYDRAFRLGISRYQMNGYVPASWLSAGTVNGWRVQNIVKQAKPHNAVKDAGPGCRPRWWVKESWADAFAERRTKRKANAHLVKTWLTYDDIAYELGKSRKQVVSLVRDPKHSKLGRLFATVERRDACDWEGRPRVVFHPVEASQAISAYKAITRRGGA